MEAGPRVTVKMEPVDIKVEPGTAMSNGSKKKKSPGRPKKMKQEKITDHMIVKPKRKIDRFKGMSEEEVLTRLLPDHLVHNLDIVIVGINPGLYAAFVGHHYAGPGNHFWKCMYLSGLIPEQMNAMQDFKLLDYGIGFTNIVERTSRGSADLKKKEIQEGAEILTKKLLEYKPKIAVFNGKGIYEVFVGHKKFYFGKQPENLPGTDTAVYVMPSSSARCSQLPRAVDKVPFYEALKKFRDHLNGKLPDLVDSEITFPDLELKTAKKVKKEEPGEVYPGEEALPQFPTGSNLDAYGADQLGNFVSGSYQVIPHSFPQASVSGDSVPMLSRVKQEPVEINEDNSSFQQPVSKTEDLSQSLPSWKQFGEVKIKQEPGTTGYDSTAIGQPCQFSTGCDSTPIGQPCQFSQVEYLGDTQSRGAVPNHDRHLNSFLQGMYGLVSGVSQQEAAYGMVNNAVVPSSQPLQFSEALLNIVKVDADIAEGESESQCSIAHGGILQGSNSPTSISQTCISQSNTSQSSVLQNSMSQANMSAMSTPNCVQPKKKTTKPRKRKSTDAPSSTVTSPSVESQSSLSSSPSQISEGSQRSPSQVQESPCDLSKNTRSSPTSFPNFQPLQTVGPPPQLYNSYSPTFNTANPYNYPPFTTAPYFMASPPNVSNSYHAGPVDFSFPHQSFSAMLGQFGMPANYEQSIGLSQEAGQNSQNMNGYSSQGQTNSQGPFQPNMAIKQEKPDYS